jgi:hypothetical protein
MTRVVLVTLLLVSSPVQADDIAAVDSLQPRCGIRLLRAPADLGPDVAARLRELGACEHRLDVWLSHDDDGVFVIATDRLGRIRDRVVADGDVAATLIASWAAHSFALTDHPPPMTPPTLTRAHRADVEDAAALPPPSPDRRRSIGVAAFAGATRRDMTTSGVIGDVDLLRHSGVTVGAGVLFHRDVDSSYFIVRENDGFFEETGRWGGAAFVVLRWPVFVSRWRFTPSVGLGVGVANHEVLNAIDGGAGRLADVELAHDTSVGPRIEGSAAVGYRFGDRLEVELSGGWMFSGYSMRSVGVDPTDHSTHAAIGLRLR